MAQKFCQKCGKEILIDGRFCMFCGADLTGKATPNAAPTAPVTEMPAVSFEPVQPMVEETPVVDVAPVVEETPVVDVAPVVEETPVVDVAPVVEEIPVVDVAPVVTETVEETPVVTEVAIETPVQPAVMPEVPLSEEQKDKRQAVVELNKKWEKQDRKLHTLKAILTYSLLGAWIVAFFLSCFPLFDRHRMRLDDLLFDYLPLWALLGAATVAKIVVDTLVVLAKDGKQMRELKAIDKDVYMSMIRTMPLDSKANVAMYTRLTKHAKALEVGGERAKRTLLNVTSLIVSLVEFAVAFFYVAFLVVALSRYGMDDLFEIMFEDMVIETIVLVVVVLCAILVQTFAQNTENSAKKWAKKIRN